MKDRFESVNEFYLPYVEKHLGNAPLQYILTCGGSEGAKNVEIERHHHLKYQKIIHYEILNDGENIPYPTNPYSSVNLIYADVGGGSKCHDIMMKHDIEDGMMKILDNGFVNNKLGKLVFLFFDGVGIDIFLDKKYGNYKSKDFFSRDISWYDTYNEESYSQRLDGVVFLNE